MKSLQPKRYKRLIVASLITATILVAVSFYIPTYGRRLSTGTVDKFYKRSPDAITVFTGDKGRISEAFELAKKMSGAKLLITGVHNDNSLKTIANKQISDFSSETLINDYSHLIEIDYEAKSTIGNVLSALIFIRQEKNINSMIIVSSDYHIPRIKLILSFLKEKTDTTKFYFHAVKTKRSNFYNIKRYLKEVLRLIKAVVVLCFWG